MGKAIANRLLAFVAIVFTSSLCDAATRAHLRLRQSEQQLRGEVERRTAELHFAHPEAQHEDGLTTKKSAIVRDVGDQIEPTSFDEFLDGWAQQARSLIGAHQSAVSYFPRGTIAEGQHAIALSDKYQEFRTYDVLPTGEGIWNLVIDQKLSFCLTDEELRSHPSWKNFSGLKDSRGLEHPPMRGWLAVPVLGRAQEFVGMLQLSDKYKGDFTREDLRQRTRLARLIAPSVSLQYGVEELQGKNEELLSTKNALERSNIDLQQFAYIASHDLQTPFRGIAGFTQFLQADYLGRFDRKADAGRAEPDTW